MQTEKSYLINGFLIRAFSWGEAHAKYAAYVQGLEAEVLQA